MSEQSTQVATVFDSEEQHVGEVYAKALLQAASSANKVDLVVDQLESFVSEVLQKNAGVDLILSNPKMSVEDKMGFLDRVFGSKMDITLLNFLKVLCRRQRIQFVRAMSRSATELRDEMAGRMQVLVTTSAPLDDASEKALVAKLKSTFKKDVRIISSVDPSIIGGLIVRIGDTVFDGSVNGQLSVLRRDLNSRAEASVRVLADKMIKSS
jgi:F-type H+-transporting ATPase subunit delta